MTGLQTFELDDGSVYERIPAAEFPDGDAWDSTQVEADLAETKLRSLVAVVSQNGWSANDRSVIASFTVPGTKTKIALRAGDVSVVILDFLAWWNREIESLDGSVLDDWGYAERLVRGSTTTVSNHASGTAGDANATKHPLATHTLTKPQLAKAKARIALYRGALRHGAFYTGRVDEMHVEIDAGPALVRAVADDIRAGRLGGGNPEEEYDVSAVEDKLDDLLGRVGGVQAMLIPTGGWQGEAGAVIGRIGGLQAQVAQILAIVSKGADVDEKALAAELGPVVAPLLADILKSDLAVDGLTPDEVAAAVDAGLRRVLGSLATAG